MRRPPLGLLSPYLVPLVLAGFVGSSSAQDLSGARLADLVEQTLGAAGVARPQGVRSAGTLVELTLDDAVARSLEKNLDIAVERLNPQTFDFTLAQLYSSYRPTVTSTFGRNSTVQLPRNQLTGGQRVESSTLTYNGGLAQGLRWGWWQPVPGLGEQPGRLEQHVQHVQPAVQLHADGHLRPAAAQEFPNGSDAEPDPRDQHEPGDLRGAAARDDHEHGLERAERILGPAVRPSGRRCGAPVAEPRREAGRGQCGPGRVRHDGADRRRRGSGRGRHAPPAGGPGRGPVAHGRARPQAADRRRHRGSVLAGRDRPDRPSAVSAGADRPGRGHSRGDLQANRHHERQAPAGHQRREHRSAAQPDPAERRCRRHLRSAGNRRYPAGAQQHPRRQRGRDRAGRLPECARLLFGRDYPTWNLQLQFSQPLGQSAAAANYERAKIQLQQTRAQVNALELQIAAEVTNVALQVQSNETRVEAATAARELAMQRLEAEESKFEVGMSTNFFVVQAQRDLADAQITELRAELDYRTSLVDFERVQQTSLTRAGITLVSGGGGGGGVTSAAAAGGR